jgi:hypothetical protein
MPKRQRAQKTIKKRGLPICSACITLVVLTRRPGAFRHVICFASMPIPEAAVLRPRSTFEPTFEPAFETAKVNP